MKQTPLKRGTKQLKRTELKRSSSLKQTDSLKRGKGPKRSRPKKRPPAMQVLAEVWHRIGRQKNGGFCVRLDCDAPAGEFAHHILEQRTLKRLGLEGHLFDDANSAPCCWPHNDGHSNGGSKTSRITRDDLIAAGLWAPVVAWVKDLDARYFPGRQPVLSRLERDYPAREGDG